MNKSEHIADLSQIWKHVSVVFPYFDKAKIDWDKEYFEYIQKIIDVKTKTSWTPDIFKEISPEDFKNGFDSVLDFGIDFFLKSES